MENDISKIKDTESRCIVLQEGVEFFEVDQKILDTAMATIEFSPGPSSPEI